MIVAIDGPAGSGKSTIAKFIARKLGLLYIDTGAMYRSLTLKAMQKKLDLTDEQALIDLAGNTKIKLNPTGARIRTPEVTNNISYIANVPGVRLEMVKWQRAFGYGSKKGAVLEGRDIGTVVFPDADRKFYLTASVKERAQRRFKELKEKGMKINLKQIEKDIIIRDKKDIYKPSLK